MLRCGKQVQLIERERHTYRALTGCVPARPIPDNIRELTATLESAAQVWEQSEDLAAEGAILADLARNFVANNEIQTLRSPR
jgi:hypothetical protein